MSAESALVDRKKYLEDFHSHSGIVILSEADCASTQSAQSKDLWLLFRMRRLAFVFMALAFFAPRASVGQKLKDADCLTCHGDSTLTTDENGKQASLFVDKDK